MNARRTRRLYLPSGNSFDLELPDGDGLNELRGAVVDSPSSKTWVWGMAAAGLGLGGLLTWLLLRPQKHST